MKYMGSKRRIAKEILPIILKDRKPGQWYVEPFCGGCNVIDKVDNPRIANDYNEYVSAMWDSLINKNWIPPESISEEEYKLIKYNKEKYPKELVEFCGVALTFGSTWFGTYARNKKTTNYAMEGRSNLLRQIKSLKGCVIKNENYLSLYIPEKSIVYCDPPYKGVFGYKDDFDHDLFWNWCKEKTNEGHNVFISEYNAPKDFMPIWEQKIKTNMNAKYNINSIEKLFIYNKNL